MINRLIIITVCLLFFDTANIKSMDFSESGNGDNYKCFIVISNNNSKITFIGMFKNNKYEQINIYYKLGIMKKSISGNSNNTQSGELPVKGFTEIVLSKASFNLIGNDAYTITLQVYNGNRIISSDSLVFNNSN